MEPSDIKSLISVGNVFRCVKNGIYTNSKDSIFYVSDYQFYELTNNLNGKSRIPIFSMATSSHCAILINSKDQIVVYGSNEKGQAISLCENKGHGYTFESYKLKIPRIIDFFESNDGWILVESNEPKISIVDTKTGKIKFSLSLSYHMRAYTFHRKTNRFFYYEQHEGLVSVDFNDNRKKIILETKDIIIPPYHNQYKVPCSLLSLSIKYRGDDKNSCLNEGSKVDIINMTVDSAGESLYILLDKCYSLCRLDLKTKSIITIASKYCNCNAEFIYRSGHLNNLLSIQMDKDDNILLYDGSGGLTSENGIDFYETEGSYGYLQRIIVSKYLNRLYIDMTVLAQKDLTQKKFSQEILSVRIYQEHNYFFIV